MEANSYAQSSRRWYFDLTEPQLLQHQSPTQLLALGSHEQQCQLLFFVSGLVAAAGAIRAVFSSGGSASLTHQQKTASLQPVQLGLNRPGLIVLSVIS